ncbi:hypothetical protein BDP55DRAFT_71910 [Colletotrichum godetiae]|uniref:Uncharacterized protein n=1 Tax=Colletotrichum godetiae TaxID=1209918 RepID=A0AAJ0ASA7_9PEZI|nr:uncharacterized protein BDP55DRAFT_71910 [Colletotrichum godetiae]KAK1687905.1 hypothetical protein BDP55DRAFT_71910 [Colletotrichum godetiae]
MTFDNKYDQHLEEGLLPVAVNEKGTTTTSTPSRKTTPPNKMTATRRVLLTVLVCGLMTLSLASAIGHGARPCTRDHQEQVLVAEGEVKDATKVDLIHRLLHAYFPDRYQDGVYASDKEAIAAFQADDADLASALGQLEKRQDNGTSSAAPAATPTPSASDAATPSASSAAPTSDTPAQTPTPTPTPSTPATTSAAPPASSSAEVQQSSSTPQQTSAAQTTAQQSSQQPPASNTPTTQPTSAAAAPTSGTTRQGTTTTTPRRTTTSYSEVKSTFTSTASNGDVVLVTATSFVAVDPEPAATSGSGSGGSSGSGGLQNVAVPIGRVSVLPIGLAAFVVGAMLLL